MTTISGIDSLIGRTVRWTFSDGPVAGTTFEHDFHDDGTVTWRGVSGPGACAPRREPRYAAVRMADDVWVVSYKSDNGFALTVALNLSNHHMAGFASNGERWYEQKGTFELL